MDKPADNLYPIHELLQRRWSPRAFSRRPIEPEKLLSLFEAARWSPSGVNLQPWSFLFASQEQPEAFRSLHGTLTERNQRWAASAPVLIMTLARRTTEDGRENPWATYDLGQSVAHLSVEATSLGLSVHQMGGFDIERARSEFQIPEEYAPVTIIAVGYPGSPDDLPDDFRQRELEKRRRKDLSEFVFLGEWNRPIGRTSRELTGAGRIPQN